MSGLVDLGIGDFISGLMGMGKELIEDKDKRNEFNMRVKEMEGKIVLALIQQKTTPKVDATVKLLHAFIPFFRPLGGALMTAFGAYALATGMEIPVGLEAVLISAFPAWGASRYKEKMARK